MINREMLPLRVQEGQRTGCGNYFTGYIAWLKHMDSVH